MIRWECHVCGGPGVRNVGTQGFCGAHLTELYVSFSPEVFASMHGVGLQYGPMRPDWGPAYADLECSACEAAWTGVPGDACWWCQRSHAVMLEHQAELVLARPDVHRADARYEPAMSAWARRLANAVKAGVVDERRAWLALEREVRRAA